MLKRPLLLAIRAYQVLIGRNMPSTCRFVPSCSHYTYEAIEKHGPLKGVLLGGWRILRCNPLSPGGYDPVP